MGADTPPVPAGGVVPDVEVPPQEVNPPAASPPPAGGFTSADAARMVHPSNSTCPQHPADVYRQVTGQIVDDAMLLVAANEPATLREYNQRCVKIATSGDPRRIIGVLAALSTMARSMAETPHPDGGDLVAVMVDFRSRFDRVYDAAATWIEGQSR